MAGVAVGTVAEVRGEENDDIFDSLVVSVSALGTKYVPSELVGPITEGRIELTVATSELR